MPYLVFPSAAVRDSFLAGEGETCRRDGTPTDWLAAAAADFDGFVARRRAVTQRWDVPVTELWYIDGPTYLGTVLVRHRLTAALQEVGGHIGYHVVPAHRRRGHATRMLAEAIVFCRHLGLTAVLLTTGEANTGSRRVIEANGGVLTTSVPELHYWLAL